ncbi:SurA N-terminal domain-containing protein, partial [Betaproteobacteria bacterium]|nr:SurA N-terminal domain-containing protein [Betaproteobacteria bacterium]
VGNNIPDEMLNSDEVKKATLDNMINQFILQKVVSTSRIGVSESDVRTIILGIPEFHDGKGVFNLDQAKKVLGRQGMTTVDFENRLKADLSLALIPEILNASNFVPRTIVRKLARAENEKRTFGVKLFSPLSYKNKVKVTDTEVKNFFDDNGSRFVIPATYDIDFIVLENDDKIDEIGNLLYEENSSLDPVAEKFNLKVQRITRLDLNAPAIGGGKFNNNALRALNDRKFRSELFSEDFLIENYNTELIQVAKGLHIAANLVKQHAAVPMQFDVVKDQIKSEILLQKMNKLAKEEADTVFEEFKTDSQLKKSLRKVVLPFGSREDQNNDEYVQLLQQFKGELFSYELQINQGKVLNLGSSGAALVFFLSSELEEASSKRVVESLQNIFGIFNSAETDLVVKAWLRDYEEQMKVDRYLNVLLTDSAIAR